jgi:hypothetical protein
MFRRIPARPSRAAADLRSTARQFRVVLLLAALAAIGLAPSAQARNLAVGEAEAAARAIAPAAVVDVRCLSDSSGRPANGHRKALCLLSHPTAETQQCRSFVVVKAPANRRGGAVSARRIGSVVCFAVGGGRDPQAP